MHDEALTFVQYMRPQLSAPDVDQGYVINMDQTPVYFLMAPRTNLNLMCNSTIHIASTDGSTTRVPITVGVTASGNLFKPILTFKESPTGHIAFREFQTYTNRDECLLTCQKKAWVNKENFMKWIDGILAPYLEGRPVGVTQIVMFLDSYTAHKMGSIVQRIKNLGARVYHIPGGCTYLAQPVDIGIGRPLKLRIRELWHKFVMEQGTDTAIFRTPDRETVAKWVTDAHTTITVDIIKNAWQKTGLSYFENE